MAKAVLPNYWIPLESIGEEKRRKHDISKHNRLLSADTNRQNSLQEDSEGFSSEAWNNDHKLQM